MIKLKVFLYEVRMTWAMQYLIAMLIVIKLQMRYCSGEGFAVKIDCSNYCTPNNNNFIRNYYLSYWLNTSWGHDGTQSTLKNALYQRMPSIYSKNTEEEYEVCCYLSDMYIEVKTVNTIFWMDAKRKDQRF